jgi:hypothetical protein
VLSELAFSNACWKQSRGQADWVIVTDMDEHLYHPDGRDYLARCAADGITFIPALGFQMISETRPEPGQNLSQDFVIGTPWVQMMKPSVFNPDAIEEMNFTPGRHKAEPVGRIKAPPRDELKLFHYKYIGFDDTQARHEQLRQGLGAKDVENRWGHKYAWSPDQLRSDWNKMAAGAVDTRLCSASCYPLAPWWEKYRV